MGWICALACELAAARAMLDHVEDYGPEQDPSDHNVYIFGRLGGHKVIIACLPAGSYGTNSAAAVARDLSRSFKSIRIGLLVGIGGGAPSPKNDIRLGDIVISQPDRTLGGVVQYDLGKTLADGKIHRVGTLNAPPRVLMAAVTQMKAKHLVEDSQVPKFLSEMVANKRKMQSTFKHPGTQNDHLYAAEYCHVEDKNDPDSCQGCDSSYQIPRPPRESTDPEIHYGIIASGNQVMRDGVTRDRLRDELGALCFEMEAAGLMQDFPCIVIRGICDYSDSHKNKKWQNYAAATAAAYTKEILLIIPATYVLRERPIIQVEGQ